MLPPRRLCSGGESQHFCCSFEGTCADAPPPPLAVVPMPGGVPLDFLSICVDPHINNNGSSTAMVAVSSMESLAPISSGSSSAMLFCCFNSADIIRATEAEPVVCTRIGPPKNFCAEADCGPAGGEGFGEQMSGDIVPRLVVVKPAPPPPQALANEVAEGERESPPPPNCC